MNEDEAQEIENIVEEACHSHERRKEDKAPWGFTPQAISTIIAALTVITGFFWTVSDFRVNLTDQSLRITTFGQRIAEIEKRLSDLDVNGTRGQMVNDIIVKNLREDLNELRETTKNLNEALMHHNDLMMQMYGKKGKSQDQR